HGPVVRRGGLREPRRLASCLLTKRPPSSHRKRNNMMGVSRVRSGNARRFAPLVVLLLLGVGCGAPSAPSSTSPRSGESDIDGDGVSDVDDECPLDAAKSHAGVCGCYVDDRDFDGDGALDCQDGCPLDPEETATGCQGFTTWPPTLALAGAAYHYRARS